MPKETSIMDDMQKMRDLLDEHNMLSAPTVLKRPPNRCMKDFRVSASMHKLITEE
jgi:hypothetical protein